ncbi:MAG: FAD-binding protein, partial [Burkholderiaceae bacterium]|nr:FAD-binding protein [Burkholderiaceae bacterium]
TIGQTLSAIGSGVIDAFSRTFARGLQAPYYAIRVTGALFHTQGGLDVDASCRVLDVTGQHFPNMWAGGGAARGVSGPDVSGYLSGNGLLSAIAGGTISADSMATFLDQG